MKIILRSKHQINNKIDNIIKDVSNKRKISSRTLAKSSKLSESMIRGMKNKDYRSTPSIDSLKRIAVALKLPRRKLASILLINIGDRIKYLRSIHNMKRTELAKRLGISKNALANIEWGRTAIKVDCLNNLSRIFHVNDAYIMCNSDDSNKNSITTRTKKNSDKKINLTSCININMNDILCHKSIPINVFYGDKKISFYKRLSNNVIRELLVLH